MPEFSLSEIAETLGGTVEGDGTIRLVGCAGIGDAREGELTFFASARYADRLETTRAAAIVIGADTARGNLPAIRVDDPEAAFARAALLFATESPSPAAGVHERAIVEEGAEVAPSASIGPLAVISAGASIGPGTRIAPQAFVGPDVAIGADCVIHSNVTIEHGSSIGDRVIVHAGTVIGADGFGYDHVEGRHHKIPQLGSVEIGDDVEIGANVTIDRARFGRTVIGRGTKIDNLVMVAHNCLIGEDVIIVGMAGMAGSVTIGNNVIVAAQAGLNGHITIGDGAIVLGCTAVTKDVAPGLIVKGLPAQPREKENRERAMIRRLGRLYEQVKEIDERLGAIES